MNSFLSINWLLAIAAWFGINGILHDIFIVKAHQGAYNRDLLRLLMDGHVLILSGVLLLVCWYMLRANINYGAIIGLIVAIGMIVYCAMIFPFLKSFVTLFLSFVLGIVCIMRL